MAADNNIMDTINGILQNPDAINSINDMISANKGTGTHENAAADPATMAKLSNIAAAMADKSDPKINLLYALKPYMNGARAGHIDKAIKMIQMTKITGFLKDL